MLKIYDFECPKCKKIFEKMIDTTAKERQNHDPKIPRCDDCKVEMKRLISGPAFHLKGPGWSHDNYGLKPTKENK